RIEDEISKERDRVTFTLESVIKQLHEIYWNKDNNTDIITSDQIADAMSEELEELRDRLQADIELSQLGLDRKIIRLNSSHVKICYFPTRRSSDIKNRR